jgi:hypothetical protein
VLLVAAGLVRAQQEQLPTTTVGGQRIMRPADEGPMPPPEPPASFTPPAFAIPDSRSAPVANTIGASPSASQGLINQLDIANQPILRAGDILDFIPGLFVADHTGTVKANELFLRGFFLDHGTDFSVWIDDVPYNMPNHPHLHGYDDFNALIPELVRYIDFKKGVYYPEAGDFSSAGTARITMMDSLPAGILKSEVGKDSYFRELIANSDCLGQGTLLYAFDGKYFNGPWEFPENARLFKGILRYTMGDEDNGLRLTAWAYSGIGRINDNIPQLAVQAGVLDRFGTLDPFEGITTQRDQLNLQWWHRDDAGDLTKANLYYIYYRFRIFTNTTGTAIDDAAGNFNPDGSSIPDEFEQFEHRSVYGGNLSQSFASRIFGDCVRNTFGLQTRFDLIPALGVNHTDARNLLTQLDDASIQELNIGLYWQNEIKWGAKVRTVLGLRGDYFHWDVDDFLLPENSGHTEAKLFEPKGSLILGPWNKTEFYLNGGFGFHTNDARGIFNTLTPDFVTGAAGAVPSDNPLANPIARSRGAEVGMKSQLIPNLTTTVALWYLRLESELVFDPFGVANGTPRGASERYGVELSNTYRLNRWLTIDADYAASEAHFLQPDPDTGGTSVDQAVGIVMGIGPTIRLPNGMFAAMTYRYLGPRALVPDNSIASRATNMFDLGLGYERPRLTAGVDLLNLFNSNTHEIDFANTEGVTVNGQNFVGGTTFHPAQPFQARFYLTLRW